MLILLSPAKRLHDHVVYNKKLATQPLAKSSVEQLIHRLQGCSVKSLSHLMGISESIARLNVKRYADFNCHCYSSDTSTPAVLTFDGDVYRHLQAASMSEDNYSYLKNHLVILSGLYGVLRAFDYMQPYRLEMGTDLIVDNYPNLYAFWQHKMPNMFDQLMKSHSNKIIINLASQEYFKAVKKSAVKYPVITFDFKQKKADTYRTVGILAKRARGAMARYMTLHAIDNPEDCKSFREDGYRYLKKLSTDDHWVFVN